MCFLKSCVFVPFHFHFIKPCCISQNPVFSKISCCLNRRCVLCSHVLSSAVVFCTLSSLESSRMQSTVLTHAADPHLTTQPVHTHKFLFPQMGTLRCSKHKQPTYSLTSVKTNNHPFTHPPFNKTNTHTHTHIRRTNSKAESVQELYLCSFTTPIPRALHIILRGDKQRG